MIGTNGGKMKDMTWEKFIKESEKRFYFNEGGSVIKSLNDMVILRFCKSGDVFMYSRFMSDRPAITFCIATGRTYTQMLKIMDGME